MFNCSRDAIRVKVKKFESKHEPEYRKFSVDPQITSIEVLQSILIKAFDIKGEFTVSYKAIDDFGKETYLFLRSDWDLDAAFISASEPFLNLQVTLKPFGETNECEGNWGQKIHHVVTKSELGLAYKTPRIPGIIMNKVEKTFNLVQRAFGSFSDDSTHGNNQSPPLNDVEFRKFLDPIGRVTQSKELRRVIYFGGIEPSLRKVVWKHILNVYPEGMSGRERISYMKLKSDEYVGLRDAWKNLIHMSQNIGDLACVTNMVRKDVLRTDRHHKFYEGSDDNQNTASLFNILTTYALNHPSVTYCQGMSDLASPLLITMRDEAQAYICLCALMRRLKDNFMLDGVAMTTKFAHLSEGLQYYDPEFFTYLKLHQADDLLFCYRWLLLEMKREFALDEAMCMLEVLWASIPSPPIPNGVLDLYEVKFPPQTPPVSPNSKQVKGNAYTKVCAIRRQSSTASISSAKKCIDNANESFPGNTFSKRPLSRLSKQRQSHTVNDTSEVCNRRKTLTEKGFSIDSSLTKAKPFKRMTSLLDFEERLGNLSTFDQQIKTQAVRVVKNLNEFLNFTSLNKSRIMPSSQDSQSSESNIRREIKKKDSNSPDDNLTDFYPMTTLMTRELRLELESLDRQVFGPTLSMNQKLDKTPSKHNKDKIEADIVLAKPSPEADFFVGEDPLHLLQNKQNASTPDEQADLEYDGEIIEDQNGVKSITPIKLLKTTTNCKDVSDSDTTDSWPQEQAVTFDNSILNAITQEKCEEATELTNILNISNSDYDSHVETDGLPPPNEFGMGNAFLIFLCLTLLLQHRDFIMRNHMDYNELAMHFDKMVRRHDVIKVLNQARQLFAEYLTRHTKKSELL